MKKKIGVFLLLLFGAVLSACAKEAVGTKIDCYYVNLEGNVLLQEEYLLQEDGGEKAVEELLQALAKPQDASVMQSAIPKEVKLLEYELDRSRLHLTFEESYLELPKSQEVLLRAAVVQTLVQIPEIGYVSFYVEDQPLLDSSGIPIGQMNAGDFVQNTGSSLKSYQTTDLRLYFANKDGTNLSEELQSEVRYNINTSIEKLVMEKLMKGSNSDKRKGTIPDTVSLIGVSVKDGICYVNFDSKFLTDGYNQKPEVAIYSIVNSIIANGNATRVQILVEGSKDVTYMNSVDLREPLSWKSGLLED
ncbi:MAG: GerMN domain-containing protein [Faecalimonas sp.]|nr:GerMN domain-containing protein [Faecalimonas sp.]